jgi:hypothetical protein
VTKPYGQIGHTAGCIRESFRILVRRPCAAASLVFVEFGDAALEVMGQNPEGFHQAGGQGGDQDHRQDLENGAELPGQKRERNEHATVVMNDESTPGSTWRGAVDHGVEGEPDRRS